MTADLHPRPMRRRTLVALTLLVVGVAACAPAPTPPLGSTFGPSSSVAAVRPPASPIVVSLDRTAGGPVHVGYPVTLSIAAVGTTGIQGVELWAGGDKVGYAPNARPDRPAITAHFEWTPATASETVLVARAYDAAGRVSLSAPLRLTPIAGPPRSVSLTEVRARAGESWRQVVARAGGDLSQAAYWNAGLPDGPLPAGTTVAVPILDPVIPPAAARGPDDQRLVADVGPTVPLGLAIPQLQLAVDGCTVDANASGGTPSTAGFALSVLPPTGDTFLALPPVAPSSGGTGTTSFGAIGGVNLVTVTAYTADAAAPSAIVPITVPPECGGGWTGDARLEAGHLMTSAAADRAYLYLRVGTAGWTRVPSAPGTFIEAANGSFDFSSDLPAIAGQDLAIEAWGWSGGQLVKLGTGAYKASGQVLYSGAYAATTDLVGFGTGLDIVLTIHGGEILDDVLTRHSAVDLPGPNSSSAMKQFKWQTTVPGVTDLQWQILPYPLAGSANPTPPFLIDTGTVHVQGNASGYFSIDLKPYLTGKTSGVTSASTWLQEQVIKQLLPSGPYAPKGTPAPPQWLVNPNGIWLPNTTPAPTGQPGGASGTLTAIDNVALLTPPLTALYVRVIPYQGTTPVNKASNTVSFDIVQPGDPFYLDPTPPAAPPQYDNTYTMQAVFFGPTGSDPNLFRCVRVAKGGYVDPVLGDWSNKTVHCPPKKDDSWSLTDAFESFVDWVGSVWDYVSNGYDWIQNKVVDAVLAIVPCKAIADQVTDSGQEVCHDIAKTGLQAAMLAFGIPPEIPSWESTISAAKGDLREFILENAKEQFPAVAAACDAADVTHAAKGSFPTCDALVDKAIDTAIDQIESQRSQAAAAAGGFVVPPGVVVEPDPRSTPQPPHFEVTLTRTSAPLPSGTVCSMTASMTSSLTGWTWNEYQWSNGDPTVVQKTGTVHGEPFGSHSQAIAPLAPGQSAKYDIWLGTPEVWFEPDGWNDHYAEQYAEWRGEYTHAWVLLQQGATIKGLLTSNCFPDASASGTLTGQAWQ